MNGLILGAYAIFFMVVGFKGRSKQLLEMGQNDAPGFLPWAISIGVLAVMYENDYTKKIAEPFILLLVVTFVLRNFDMLKSQFNELSNLAAGVSPITSGGGGDFSNGGGATGTY